MSWECKKCFHINKDEVDICEKCNWNPYEGCTVEHTCTEPHKTAKESNGAEETLNAISVLLLITGIATTIIVFFNCCFIETMDYEYNFGYNKKIAEKEFNAGGLIPTLITFISTLATWATMRVFVNISMTLKKINNKLDREIEQ